MNNKRNIDKKTQMVIGLIAVLLSIGIAFVLYKKTAQSCPNEQLVAQEIQSFTPQGIKANIISYGLLKQDPHFCVVAIQFNNVSIPQIAYITTNNKFIFSGDLVNIKNKQDLTGIIQQQLISKLKNAPQINLFNKK